MNKRTKNLIRFLIVAVVFLTACSPSKKASVDYVSYVDPLIGSAEHGHVFVGASLPFGAVQLGPSNIYKGWDWCSAYHYSDSIVAGFSHTHLSGTGVPDLGDVLIMPTTGKATVNRGKQEDISNGYASKYSHENEITHPNYYSLLLDKYDIKVELTASDRVGMHKYTFPTNASEEHVVIDLEHGNGDSSYDTYLKQIDETTIEGYRFSHGWSSDQLLFFTLKTSVPVTLSVYDENQEQKPGKEIKSKGVKGILSFDSAPKELLLKVGISPVSCKNALANIEAEIPGWDFEDVVSHGKEIWNKELSKIAIKTNSKKDLRTFYTALYHSMIAPSLYNDHNGDFMGHDKKVYTGKEYNNYTTFSLWDTYRTESQLLTLTEPERVDDMISSMIGIFREQGKLPVWPLTGCETDCMPGYSAVPVVVDAYLKGFTGFDAEEAFQALKISATNPKQRAVPWLLSEGFIPCDSIHGATSIAMEYSVDDWSIAQMAKKMGKKEDFAYFSKRANYYKQYFDPEIKFVRPLVTADSWRTPYSPIWSPHDFTEGNGWQYTFFVPQDPNGLIDILGGDEAFTQKLDTLFIIQGEYGKDAPPDITGLVGQYAQGNEPSHHVPYLYAYAGKQWKTAEKVRMLIDKFYLDKPDGLAGNEDCGQMSAWYIMSAMGFYPVSPSGGIYVFGSPLFDEAVLSFPLGKTFTIKTVNNSDENIYIQSVTLNGKPYTKGYIAHKDVVAGGVLEFVMGNEPNCEFATSQNDRPKTIM